MNKLSQAYRHFHAHPRDMRVLLLTNLAYAFVLPVIDIFMDGRGCYPPRAPFT